MQNGKQKPWTVLVALTVLGAAVLSTLVAQKKPAKPLGEARAIVFPMIPIPKEEAEAFLRGDFRIIRDMRALPQPIVQAYTETGGTRLTIANPGERYEATDAVHDNSLPPARLLMSGINAERCFILFERGGVAHSYVLALFELKKNQPLHPVAQTYCEPATNLTELREHIVNGNCSTPTTKGIR